MTALALVMAAVGSRAAAAPHNVILFVADGLRSRIVTPQTAPALAEVRARGVDFRNSHSIYPTVTTPNASVIATGHLVGDTGDFGNTIYGGQPFPAPYGSPMAPVEDDVMLGLLNERFGGNYLGHTSLLQAARAKGFATVALGKLGPIAIQDVTARDGTGTIVIDDATGSPERGVKLAPEIAAAIKAAGLPTTAPSRGPNGQAGAYDKAGALVANVEQQNWFLAVATRVLLPRFKAEGKPFVMVFWSRDPDGTQHNQGDSLNTFTPGINGPTTMAAIRNASDDLAALRASLRALGLDKDTDIVVTADHGFSTLSRESQTSGSARLRYPDVKPGLMPPGFLAIDLAEALGLPLHDAAGPAVDPRSGAYPKRGAALGRDAAHPDVLVAANGGSDLIYLPGPDAPALARRIVEAVSRQDYAGAIFVRDDLGPIPGALSTSQIGLAGSARTPTPAIVVGFRSFASGCDDPEICGVEVADSDQQQGQGIHGSFGRQDTHNFMAAVGPDFRAGFVDPAPVSNADLAITLAHILELDLGPKGHSGRVMAEALSGRDVAPPASQAVTVRSAPAANGFMTVLNRQDAAGASYFDAAGMPGRTIGLKP
ncbi:alkaline phosphatase family protein [Phenylobacterium hankyongense]|uniref:Alkaline phosphatase family protein n=2 Tax=Phenylobacterium hankyongense TaxID=1813876 RepID=A0A328B1T2_9CAUL|nr:alkaline phosphatase family protein [Phenylobacterium hankyongense]